MTWLILARTQSANSWFKIWIRISDLRSLGSQYIKWMDESFPKVDLSVLWCAWIWVISDYGSRIHSSRNHYAVTFFFQDVSFVDTLVNLAGVIIECLDFSIPGLFALATTAAGKSPNTTPTKWTRRFQKPMGNFTSLVHLIAKLLSACERTSTCKVCIGPEQSSAR